MNFQNDETNGHVHVIQQINHTKMIVVIPKSTQRIDFTMTLIMMNGYTPGWAIVSGCCLTPASQVQLTSLQSPGCSQSPGAQCLPPRARLRPGPGPWSCLGGSPAASSSLGEPRGSGALKLTKLLSKTEKGLTGYV